MLGDHQTTSISGLLPVGQREDARTLGDVDRRRNMWSFLTWAFFLSEAFKGSSAEAASVASADSLEWQKPALAIDDPASQSPAGDVPTYSDWLLQSPPDSAAPSQIALAFHEPADTGEFGTLGHLGSPSSQAGHGLTAQTEAGTDLAEASAVDASTDGTSAGGLPLPGFAPVSVDLPLGLGETVQNLLGGAVVTLDDLVIEPALSAVSGVTQVVSTLAGTLTSGLLGNVLGSDGVLSVLGASASNDGDLFVGGRYTDYHMALQTTDAGGPLDLLQGTVGAGIDLGDVVGSLVSGDTHHADQGLGLSGIVPSAMDELVLRGSVDLVM